MRLMSHLTGDKWLIAMLLYGGGLRLRYYKPTQASILMRRSIGLLLVLTAIVSVLVIHRHTRQLAFTRLDEFNQRDPDFGKRNYWIKTTPSGDLGLQEILPDRRAENFFAGSAIIHFPEGPKNAHSGEIWEITDGRIALLSSPNLFWTARTDPVLVCIAAVIFLVGVVSVMAKPRRQQENGVHAKSA